VSSDQTPTEGIEGGSQPFLLPRPRSESRLPAVDLGGGQPELFTARDLYNQLDAHYVTPGHPEYCSCGECLYRLYAAAAAEQRDARSEQNWELEPPADGRG
jgi:hypothetical protein